MLAKSKCDSVETLISQAINDMDISHKELIIFLDKKDKYDRMKEKIKYKNKYKKQKIIKFDNIK